MHTIFEIITGVPWWAWLILVELLVVGIRATRPVTMHIGHFFIIPAILIFLHRAFLVGGYTEFYVYIGMGLISSLSVYYITLTKTTLVVHKKSSTLTVPGSYATLIGLLIFFALQCYFGFLHSEHPAIALQYCVYEAGINAVLLGFFLGRASAYAVKAYTTK